MYNITSKFTMAVNYKHRGLANGIAFVSINEVNLRQTRLVLGWVTVSGFNFRCPTFISVCNQPLRSTQPGHSFVGRRYKYQLKGLSAEK